MRVPRPAAQPLRRPRPARGARLAARRRLQRRPLGAAQRGAARALLADRARAAGGPARARPRARRALQGALRRARARERRARPRGAARAHRRRARLRPRLPDGARRRAPLRQRAQARARRARLRARARARPGRVRRADAPLRRARPERGRRTARRRRGGRRADDDPRGQGPRVPRRVRARSLALDAGRDAAPSPSGPTARSACGCATRAASRSTAPSTRASRPPARRPTRPRATASPTSPGRARATGCCSAAGSAAADGELQRVLGQLGIVRRALGARRLRRRRSRARQVRVHVHTGDDVADRGRGAGAAGRGAVELAARGQLSLFDVAARAARRRSPDCRRRSRRCRAAALHVPRALSYSALALHDRCGFRTTPSACSGCARALDRGRSAARARCSATRCTAPSPWASSSACRRPRAPTIARASRRSSPPGRGRRSRRACARRARIEHELPFAFCEDDVVLRGSLDVCVRDADGSLLVADLKTTALGGREPEAVVESEYALQRAIYALARPAQRGAVRARSRSASSSGPEETVSRGATPQTTPAALAGEVRAAIARLRSSGFTRARRRALRDLPGARPPLPGAGLARASRVSRLDASSPPESRVRAILRRLRRRLSRRALLARLHDAVGAARGDDPLGAVHRRARQHGHARAVPPLSRPAGVRGRRARARSPRRSSRPASTTRRRARCAARRWPCSSATTARCRAAPISSCSCRAWGARPPPS